VTSYCYSTCRERRGQAWCCRSLACLSPLVGGARQVDCDFPVNTLGDSVGYLTEVTPPACNDKHANSPERGCPPASKTAGATPTLRKRYESQPRGIHLNAQPSNYDALVRPIQDQMLRSIWRITRVAEDAEDALQEALAIIWQRRVRIERHPCPQALMLRICVNCACDVLRARLRRGARETQLTEPNDLHTKDCPVDERLRGMELHDEISRALVRLPRRQATAVMMRYMLELPYDNIGSALGCSDVTARVHVNRARKKLSKLLAHLAR
jgi:RNA polymerase sigma factor (sigma-70 family)